MKTRQERILKQIKIAWLMADYPLGYTPLFFGQFSLLQDFSIHWRHLDMDGRQIPVQQFYVGSRVAGPNTIQCKDPTRIREAYISGVDELCADGSPVIAIANFIHKDSAALGGLCELKERRKNFHMIVVLHCTRDEFLGDQRVSSGEPAGERAVRRASRLADFQVNLPVLGGENGADAFVTVSQATLRSYAPEIKASILPEQRMCVIPNGVDAGAYRLFSSRQRARKKAGAGLPPGRVAGISSRWTQAKGSHILEALLDHLETDQKWSFLMPALAHDQLFKFLGSLPERYPRLYSSGRIWLYLDISRLKRSPLTNLNKKHIQALYMENLASQPAFVRQVFEDTFIGFLETPVYHLLDLYLRPSVAEAFGLGAVEAYLCGVPVLSSNRDGLAEFVIPQHQVPLSRQIHLLGDKAHAPTDTYKHQVEQAAGDFYQMMSDPLRWQSPGKALRQRMIDKKLTVPRMIKNYNRLIGKLL